MDVPEMVTDEKGPKFRIGLVVDSALVSKYVFEFVKWSQAHERLEISHVLVVSPKSKAAGWHTGSLHNTSALSRLLFKLVIRIERLLLLKNKRYHDHLQGFDLFGLLPEHVFPKLNEDNYLPHSPHQVDLLVIFATDASTTRLSGVAKMGALKVSNSDDRIYQGGPPGFWEVYFREDVTGFTIQRMTDRAAESDVLLRGQVATQFYYLLNQASLYEKSIYYLMRVVEGIATSREFPKSESRLPYCYRPRDIPRPHQSLLYLMGLIRLAALKIVDLIRGFDFRWHVGFVRSEWRDASLWRAKVIDNPHGRYLADPFVITKEGHDFCFVEDYDQAIKRAKIVVYELGENHASFVGVALEESFHLSYPYLFQYGGELYMCPETNANRDIRIYKCVDFPLKWKLEKVIMRDIAAVDSLLFEKNGKWWLLTNTDPAQWNDFSLELRIFSANSPLEEKWTPHPSNPLLIDASCGRNGGMITEGHRVFRVAQGQGFGSYGKRTSINEIVVLNEKEYVEKRVSIISASFRSGVFGTHHLNNDAAITVFDFACR
jgi:hypothetical protein